MFSRKGILGLFLVLFGIAFILSRLPLATAFEFVQDEGYEVMKAFLCSKGFVLYKDIWNDQPPVHTFILAQVFKTWGPTILNARLLAGVFALLMFGAFYGLIKRRSSILCALIASFLLLASPIVLTLSASVMLEVPAIGIALGSALLATTGTLSRRFIWLAASGCIMGIALQIKFTAAVVAPAILVELTYHVRQTFKLNWKKESLLQAACWGVSALITVLIIGATIGKGSLSSSLESHFTGHSLTQFRENPKDFPIQWKLFLHHLEIVLAAGVAVAWAIRQNRFQQILFPTAMLAAVFAIHMLHRPWWNYYYLHFAVPFCWLSGWAVNEMFRTSFQILVRLSSSTSRGSVLLILTYCALVAAVVARSESRLEANVRQLQESPKSNQDALLAKMRSYSSSTRWVCAVEVMYPFQARLQVPPELAVVMAKRFWSGQISTGEIIDVCRRYHPEQILLTNGRIAREWESFLQHDYSLIYSTREYALYALGTRSEERDADEILGDKR